MSKIVRILVSILVASILMTGCGSNEATTTPPPKPQSEEPKPPGIKEKEKKAEDTPAIKTWTKSYGGNGEDNVSDILPTKDGGLYIIGAANLEFVPEWQGDLYLIRIDSTGEVIWEKNYRSGIWGMSITYTGDGNLLVAGIRFSDDTGIDPYLLKVDPKGNEIWSKTISGPMDEWVSTIELTSDDGFILVGNRVDPNDFITNPGMAGYGGFEGRSNILLIKVDEEGNEVWTQVYEDENNILTSSGIQTPDGGYAIAATILYFPELGDDQILMKVDENGEEVWTRTWEEGRTNARGLILTSDEKLLLITLFSPSGDPREGDADLLITKMDEDGEEIWTKTYGESNQIEMGSALAETSNGSYVIVIDRTRDLYQSDSEILLIKINPKGEVVWEKVAAESPHFAIQGIVEHPEGGYLLAATNFRGTNVDVIVVRTDAEGNISQ